MGIEDFRPIDPVDPLVPQQRGIGGQGFPNTSPADIWPELGEQPVTPPLSPPPFPSGVPRARVDDIALTAQAVLRSLIGNAWSRDAIQAFLEESHRTSFQPVHLPPWPEMPIAGTQVGATQSATVGAGSTVDIVTLTVPRGHFGFVAWFGQDTQNDVAGQGGLDWANLTWSLQLLSDSGVYTPVPSYFGIADQLGQVEAPTRINIFVPENTSLVVRVTNGSVAAIPAVKARLAGWYWPIAVRMSNIHVNGHIRG